MTKYLKPQELAAMLGVDVSTIYGWTSAKKIPYLKISRLVRFRPEEIEKWIKEREIPVQDFS